MPMVIEIPSDSEPSGAIVISGFPIEEESPSPEIQQPQQELENYPMERTWKQPANVADHTTILTLISRVVPTLA